MDESSAYPGRNRWFLSSWSLHACVTTLLADCSEYLFNINSEEVHNNDKRQNLLRNIRRVNKTCAQLRDAKIKELSDNDPEANLVSLYHNLSKTKEGRTGHQINYIGVYSAVPIICYTLEAALGGAGAVASIQAAHQLAEWLDLFAKRQPQGEFGLNYRMELLLVATLETADDWRDFAARSEMSAEQGTLQLAEPHLLRRWLLLAGITPASQRHSCYR